MIEDTHGVVNWCGNSAASDSGLATANGERHHAATNLARPPDLKNLIQGKTVSYQFSHIGLCVTDLKRSREFYEKYLGFKFLKEIRPGGSPTQDKFLALKKVDLSATFLKKDGFILELLYYYSPTSKPGPDRPINQPGL